MHFHSLVVHAHIRYTTNVITRVLPNQYLRRGIVAWHRDDAIMHDLIYALQTYQVYYYAYA
jgi:hypothetical protein